jgi:hypothetical protein
LNGARIRETLLANSSRGWSGSIWTRSWSCRLVIGMFEKKRDGVLGMVTGVATAKAAASVMALGLDP